MSKKEAERLHIMKLLDDKKILLKKADKLMRLSKRQSIRIRNSYKEYGIKGLISKKRFAIHKADPVEVRAFPKETAPPINITIPQSVCFWKKAQL